MGRFIKRVIYTVFFLIVVLAAVSFLLPREVTVTRSTTIDAPPEAIFAQVNSLVATSNWSPWLSIDPNVVQTFSGPDTGVGNRMEWSSDHPQVGSGSQEITESIENERVVTALDFGAQGSAQAVLSLTPVEGGTEVTWTLETDMGNNPVGRYMGLMMDRWVGTDYEEGLGNLKALLEG